MIILSNSVEKSLYDKQKKPSRNDWIEASVAPSQKSAISGWSLLSSSCAWVVVTEIGLWELWSFLFAERETSHWLGAVLNSDGTLEQALTSLRAVSAISTDWYPAASAFNSQSNYSCNAFSRVRTTDARSSSVSLTPSWTAKLLNVTSCASAMKIWFFSSLSNGLPTFHRIVRVNSFWLDISVEAYL